MKTRSLLKLGLARLALGICLAGILLPSGHAQALEEQEDNWLKRELKYLPAAEFLPMAVSAIERAVGSDVKAVPVLADDDSGPPNATLVGETLLYTNPQLNQVLVSGELAHLQLVDALADEIDVRPRQVHIKAIIAQVTLDDDIEFGSDILQEGRFAIADLGDDPKNGADLLRLVEGAAEEKDDRVEWVDVSRRVTAAGSALLEFTHPADPPAGPVLTIGRGLEFYLGVLAGQSDKIEILTSTHVVADNDRKKPIINAVEDLKITVTPLLDLKDEVTLTMEIELETPHGRRSGIHEHPIVRDEGESPRPSGLCLRRDFPGERRSAQRTADLLPAVDLPGGGSEGGSWSPEGKAGRGQVMGGFGHRCGSATTGGVWHEWR